MRSDAPSPLGPLRESAKSSPVPPSSRLVDTYLDELESRSIYVIREAAHAYGDKLALLWSMGKDSTTLLHLARKAFLGELPLRVIHIDTSFKFPEIYAFRARLAEAWRLRLEVAANDAALADGMSPKRGRHRCCTALKTEALAQRVERLGLRALLVGIRRDEHAIRAKERYFSPRGADGSWDVAEAALEMWGEPHRVADDTTHCRVHPLLHWREVDVWRYIQREGLPLLELYRASDGRRYRSVGCACCCDAVASEAADVDAIIAEIEQTRVGERSGRAQDKESEFMMQKLRSLGYM